MKKKLSKSICGLLLSAVMVFGNIDVTAFASETVQPETADVTETTIETEIETQIETETETETETQIRAEDETNQNSENDYEHETQVKESEDADVSQSSEMQTAKQELTSDTIEKSGSTEPSEEEETDEELLVETSGTCGDNLTWSFNESTGTLTIRGSGEMDNYIDGSIPWPISSIMHLELPSELTNIGNNAFNQCSELTEVELPSGLTSIGDQAFSNCSKLAGKLVLPDGLTSIGNGAFLNCSKLNGKLELPSALTSIGNGAFNGCSRLTEELVLPDGLISIGDSAFSNCSGLTGELILPDGLTSIGGSAFSNCSGLTGKLILPDELTDIGASAFYYCSGLNGELVLPDGLTSIGNNAFYNCSGLTGYICIPKTVKEISASAFSGCKKMKQDVYIKSKDCEFLTDTAQFYLTNSAGSNVVTIHAPKGSTAEAFANSDDYYAFEEWDGITLPGDSPTRSLESVMCTYSSTKVDVLKRAHTLIDSIDGKFKLVCTPKASENVKSYTLFTGKAPVAYSETGTFENLDPAKLKGETLSIRTANADGSFKQTQIYLKVIRNPLTPSSISLLDDDNGLSFKLNEDIPIIGGSTYNLILPELPVNAVLEDGKIKIGFNIIEKELYDSTDIDYSQDGSASARTRKSFWNKKMEGIKKNIDSLNEDALKSADILSNVKSYMSKKNLAADIPGLSNAVDFNVIGYVEAEWSDSREFKNASGSLVIQIKGEIHGSVNTAIAVVPVTVNGTFTATGELSGTIEYDFENTQLFGDLELAVTVGIEVLAGVGVDNYACIGVYGKAETGIKATLLSTQKSSGLYEWYLYGEAGVKGYFAKKEVFQTPLISSDDLKKWFPEYIDEDGHLLLYSREKKSVISSKTATSSASNTNASVNTFAAPYSNQYLDEISEWSDCNAAVALAAENPDNVLIADAYIAASPKVATVGNSTVLLYIDNNTSRATPNQTVLKYRVYDNTSKSWSTADTAFEDGTADFNPVVYSDGTDIYVIYQNSSITYAKGEDPDTDTYAGSFGISALRYDAEAQNFISLGKVNKSNCYCYAPRLSMSDKGLCATWVENSDNSLLGLTEHNRIMTSTLNGNTFSEPFTVASGLNSVTSLALGKNGSVDSLAYAVDPDNDLTTTEQEIFMTTLSGNPTKCTEGKIGGLQFALLPGMSSSVLACTADGALAYISGSSVTKLTEDGLIGNTNFVVNDNLVLFLINQNESRNVAAAAYSDGTWNTVMLTSEEDYIDSFAYDGTMFSYLTTKATKNDAEDTWDTSSSIKTFLGIEQRDAVLYHASFAPENIKPGGKLPVTLTVCNEGIKERSDLGVTIHKADGSGQAQHFVLDGKFAAGEVRECTVEMTLPDSIDASCRYSVSLDGQKADAQDNSLLLDMTLTDIALSTAYLLEIPEGEDADEEARIPMLEITVWNDSYVAADGTLTVTDPNGNTIFTQDCSIGAKGQEIYTVELMDYLPADGTSILLTAEFITDAEEYYKSNNYDDKSVYRIAAIQTDIGDFADGITVTEFKQSGYEYTGNEIRPLLYVYNKGELLEEGKDYTLDYQNNVNCYAYNEGETKFSTDASPKAIVTFPNTVTVDGESTAVVTRYFKIVPKDISGNDVSCPNLERNETGEVQHPDTKISIDGTTLVKGKDYTVTYPDEGENAYKTEGIYNILINGIGNYTGSKYILLTITHQHLYDSSYNKDGEGHWQICACGKTTAKENHTFGDWTTTKEASKTESGMKERICAVCGYKEIEIIRISDSGSTEEPSEDESSTEKPSESESSSENASESESSTENPSEENSSENESSTENPSEENPSEDESIWGDIVPEDRPASSKDIPKGLWIGGVSESYAYIGEAVKPTVRVYDSTTLLAEKSEYTIAYKNNINVGEATITVKGKGNYSGSETCTYRIEPADISGDAFYSEDFYVKIDAKKAQKPIPELYYMGTKLKNNKDFTVTYSNTSGIYAQEGTYTVTVTGIKNYTGTKTITLTAVIQIPKKKPVSITKAALGGFEKTFVYTGTAHKQTCTLTMQTDSGTKNLVEGADYTVRYANNIKAGTATVTYYGKNGYAGKLKRTYKILPYDIAADSAQKLTYDKKIQCVYAKGGAKPKPVVSFNGKALREGTDYILSYKNNKAIDSANTPSITINGKGSFKGKITIDFTITPQELSKMTLVSCDKVYNGKPGAHKITPKLMDLDGKLLSAGKDFDKNNLTYAYETAVTLENGTAKRAGDTVEENDIIPADTQIRVTFGSGTGNNYTGTFTGVYRIVKADIKSAKVVIPNQIYTGKEITPDKSEITVTLSGATLKPEDYDIVLCTDNVKKGKASVTLKGKGNYGGTKTVKFTIGAKGFLWWWRKN